MHFVESQRTRIFLLTKRLSLHISGRDTVRHEKLYPENVKIVEKYENITPDNYLLHDNIAITHFN